MQTPLYGPLGIAVDGEGNLFISDSYPNAEVYKVSASDGAMTGFAGTGFRGIGKPGGPAAQTKIYTGSGIAIGEDGVYLADPTSARIWKVDQQGILQLVAGTGSFTISGDGGPAMDAGIAAIAAIAFGPDGSLYLLDSSNARLRKIDPSGVITTVAGTGERGYSGDGGPAISATFSAPQGLAVDATGNIFLADTGNQVIRRIGLDGIIQTIAGGGDSTEDGPALGVKFSGPAALAFHPDGTLYIGDRNRRMVFRLTAGGNLEAVAGGGNSAQAGVPALNFDLDSVQSIAFDPQGDLFILDGIYVHKVDPAGMLTTVAGNGDSGGDGGPGVDALVHSPDDVAVGTDGQVYIAESEASRVRVLTRDGIIHTFAGNGNRVGGSDGSPATDIAFGTPASVDRDDAGTVYVGDTLNRKIRTVAASGIAGSVNSGTIPRPDFLAVDRRNGDIYFAYEFGYQVMHIRPGGTPEVFAGTGERGDGGDGGPADQAQFGRIAGLAVSPVDGGVYVVDLGNNRIRRVSGGMVETVAGTGLAATRGDGGPAVDAAVAFPLGIAVDNLGRLFIGSSRYIRMVDTAGVIHTIAGTGVEGFSGDGGPALEADLGSALIGFDADGDGNVYFSDQTNQRIRKLTPLLPVASAVNAAGITPGVPPNSAAAGAIVSVYGSDLASKLVVGNGTNSSLGDTSAVITDSQGTDHDAGLYFVSAGQVNLLVPDAAAEGAATVTIYRAGTAVAAGEILVSQVSPALFSANATGMGLAAAGVLIVAGDDTQINEIVAPFEGGVPVAKPIDLSRGSVYLILYGTGIRGAGDLEVTATVGGADVPVLGYAAQSQYPGLDQVNIGPLPASLAGAGEVQVTVKIGGVSTNAVSAVIQ